MKPHHLHSAATSYWLIYKHYGSLVTWPLDWINFFAWISGTFLAMTIVTNLSVNISIGQIPNDEYVGHGYEILGIGRDSDTEGSERMSL